MVGRVSGISVDFQPAAVVVGLPGQSPSQFRIDFDGARPSIPRGSDLQKSQTNYLLGSDPAQWRTHVPNYAKVIYSGLYPGIDAVFYGNGDQIEHDFIVSPGADYQQIRMRFSNDGRVSIGKDGALTLSFEDGSVQLQKPVIYQEVNGERREKSGAFLLLPSGEVGFNVSHYDPHYKLIIDPVLSFSTYISTFALAATLIATDANGDNYISGYAGLGFPISSNVFQGCTGCTTNNVVTFISKMNAEGSSLIYSTVLGGNSFAQPTGLVVDANGNAIVSGWTGATNFPTKNGQSIAPQDNNYVGFLVSLSPDGSSLNYGTLLGSSPSSSSSAMTYAMAVAVDSSGNAYVTGETGNGFFTTPSALNQEGGGNFGNQFNVYLAKFSPMGALLYSAILGDADPQNGGGGPIGAYALAVDSTGDAYVAGQAGTLWPISSNAYLRQIAGSMPYATPFVTKVAPDAKSLVYSTYLDYAYVVTGITALTNGDVLVVGNGVGPSFPTTPGAYQQNSSNGGSAFLTEFNSDGSGLVYSTVIGDASYDINHLALDPVNGNIWLAAQTSNPQFPLVTPLQSTFSTTLGIQEPISVLNQFDPSGKNLEFSTFLGGTATGYARNVAIDNNHRAHVAGAAGYGMYTTPGAYLGTVPTPGSAYSGETFAYVALVDPTLPAPALCVSPNSILYYGFVPLGSSSDLTVTVTNCGTQPLSITGISFAAGIFTAPASKNGCAQSLPAGKSCTFTVRYTPTAAETDSSTVTIQSNASISQAVLSLSGTGAVPNAYFTQENLNFSQMLIGQTSPPAFDLLTNSGQAPLNVDVAHTTITGDFAINSTNCTTPVYANGCAFGIAFTPTAAGNRTGMLTVPTNDPAHPTLTVSLSGTGDSTYPVPTVTALLNPSYPINTSSANVTVIGTNFFPTSIVTINGETQKTTYSSDTNVTFVLDPALLKKAGELPVAVVNPTPGGGASTPYPLTIYLSLPISASALIYEPISGLLYAAIPASATTNPDTVVPIDPTTGAMKTPIPVANDPNKLAASSDGTELYVASKGSHQLQRISLKTLTIEKTFDLPVDPGFGVTSAQDMQVVPGSPKSIVVVLSRNASPSEDGAALYNDGGLVNWISNDFSSNYLTLDSITFTSSPSTIYGLPMTLSGQFFTEVQVSPTGLSFNGANSSGGFTQQTGSIVRSDGALLYTNSGEVWDPASQELLGTYLTPSGSQLFYAPSVVPDPSSRRTFFLDGDAGYSYYQSLNIAGYNQSDFSFAGMVPFLAIYSPYAADLVRWGVDGFAFRSYDSLTANDPTDQIVILRSSLAYSPSTPLPVPTLSAITPDLVAPGSAALTLQLTGTGFTPASIVSVNGNARQTNYISATQVTAYLTATDIGTVGTLPVTVTTPAPGGGTSNAVLLSVSTNTNSTTVTLNPAKLTFASTPIASVSVSQVATLKNTSNSTLTIGGIFLSGANAGSFSDTTSCGKALASGASCTISVSFKPESIGTQTAILSIADDATTSLQQVTLTGTGTLSSTPTALQFIPITPCRVVDTRNPTGPFGGPQPSARIAREFDIPQGSCGIPSNALAYSLNVTAVPNGSLGYLAIWPSGESQPLVSTLNSFDGRVKANAVIIPAGTNGGVNVFVTDPANVILDLDGYFVPAGSSSAGLAFYPLTPCRVVDTRNATGGLGGPFMSGGSSRAFPILSSTCNIPSTAKAYSFNVTAVPHTPLGYLSIWPTGQTQPLVSTLNSLTGVVTANAAIVEAGTGGEISVFAQDDADVILDVNGYFAPPGTGGLSLYAVTPCRVIDTRNGMGPVNGVLSVNVVGSPCEPPSTAQAYVLNATVVPDGRMGYLTLWPAGETQPVVSTLNAVDGALTSNMAIVPTTNGSINVFTEDPTDLFLDISSYFAP